MLLSPACGPAPVTSVPLTSCAASTTAVRSGQLAQRLRHHEASSTPSSGSPILTYEQHRQPHHRHRGQQVDGDRPPQQTGQHGDAADHRLHHRRRRHQPRVDQHLAATAGPRDGQHRQRGGQHHQEGDHPVAELDGLVDAGHLGDAGPG